MTQGAIPRQILMATDMSARCDRALARAALLAHGWQSTLTVTHVVHPTEVARHDGLTSAAPSWRRPGSWARTLDRTLRADLASEGIDAASKVILGSMPDALLAAVAEEDPGLVVLGIAKDARMDRIPLGSTHVSEAQLPASTTAALQRLIERGVPESLLPDYIACAGVDLVVLGSHGRSGLSRALLGSTVESLLHSLDCDTLVVRRE